MKTAIVWFRNDLRLQDNPALQAAVTLGMQIVPVYIDERKITTPTAASWWDHHALADLGAAIHETGGNLLLQRGDAAEVLRRLVKVTGASMVCWNRRYTPTEIDTDTRIKTALKEQQIAVHTYNGSMLREPWEVLNKAGKPYRVFTPYWRACVEKGLAEPNFAADVQIEWAATPKSCSLDDLKLLSPLSWDSGFSERWKPSRADGLSMFQAFIEGPLEDYEYDRDRPDRLGTSSLSPYLRSGLIGVREIVAALQSAQWLNNESVEQAQGRRKLLAELGWREFSTYLMFHFPHCIDQPLVQKFAKFPWKKDQALLQAWKEARTGYPIVDAGLTELWHTGWMHNRVRMIVASFLVKHLMQPWQEGAEWFMHTLLDADVASNTQGWQWTAGCGADASPFFRVFNPVGQAKKFDPNGDYVRRWIPALAQVPDKYLQEPWMMDNIHQHESECLLGVDYPLPIVDLKFGRERALQAWKSIRE